MQLGKVHAEDHLYEAKRQEESLEVTCYVHLLNSCKQDRSSVLSVLENLFGP